MSDKIKLALQLVEAAITFEEYKKKHPRTRKTKSDPMFSRGKSKPKKVDLKYQELLKKKKDGHPDFKDKSDLQLADQAGLKTTLPGGKWKSKTPNIDRAKKQLKVKTQPQVEKETLNKVKDIHEARIKKNKKEFSALPQETKAAMHHALGKLREYGHGDKADKILKGEIGLKEAGDWAEDINLHGLASVFRNEPGTDHHLVMHGEETHHDLDLHNRKPGYGWTEREDALAAKYEATNPEQRIWGDKAHEHLGKDDAARKLKTLRYTTHHGLHNISTHKRILEEAKKHPEHFKSAYEDHKKGLEDQIKDQEKSIKTWKPDPKHPTWKKEDEQRWLDGNKAALKKHKEMGKLLGYEK